MVAKCQLGNEGCRETPSFSLVFYFVNPVFIKKMAIRYAGSRA
jgi:hypothetical protein